MTAANADQLYETRRRYFLQAMGVDLYVPRAELVNAKAMALPQPTAVSGKSKALGDATSETDTGAMSTRKSPAQHLDLPTTNKARKSPPALTPQQAQDPRLQLRAWRAGLELLAIDSRDGDIALPTETLLRNMLQALGYQSGNISKGENLRWPITDAGNVTANNSDQEHADARAMVQAFVEAQQQRYGFTTLLLLGSNANRFVLDPQPQALELWQTLTGPGETQAIVLPSLAEMLQQPALKKPTWHAIKHLRRNSG